MTAPRIGGIEIPVAFRPVEHSDVFEPMEKKAAAENVQVTHQGLRVNLLDALEVRTIPRLDEDKITKLRKALATKQPPTFDLPIVDAMITGVSIYTGKRRQIVLGLSNIVLDKEREFFREVVADTLGRPLPPTFEKFRLSMLFGHYRDQSSEPRREQKRKFQGVRPERVNLLGGKIV